MNESTSNSSSPSGWSAIPRGFWIGGGVLAVVAAALAGALVTRSVGNVSSTTPSAAATPSTTQPVMSAAPSIPTGSNAASGPSGMAPSLPPTQLSQADDRVPPPPTQAAPVPQPAPKPAPQAAPRPVAKSHGTVPAREARAAVCSTCGVVESVVAVRHKGDGSGLGAVTGGVLGGVLGNQGGGGNGRTALTVLGAIGGGLAGNEVEKRARSETSYRVSVRMDNGDLRSFDRAESMPVGTSVTVNGSNLRVANR